MTDRSLSRDMAEHARRAAGQPEPGLRDRIAAALEAADYRRDMQRGDLADAVMPVVQARLDAKQAEIASLRANLRTAAASLRDTAERVEQHRTVNPASLRAQARALDDITETKEHR